MTNYTRLDCFVSNTDKSAGNTLLNSVAGVSNAFLFTATVNGVAGGWRCSLRLTDAQKEAFLRSYTNVPTMRFYLVENKPDGTGLLLATSSPFAQDDINTLWSQQESVTDAALVITVVEQAIVYVASTGSTSGTGSEADPVNLHAALIGYPVKATSEILILDEGPHILMADLTTAYGANVVVRPSNPAIRPKIKGQDGEAVDITIATSGTEWKHLEIYSEPPTRVTEDPKMTILIVIGNNVKLTDLWCHDILQGSWHSGGGGWRKECLWWNPGFKKPDRWHGHIAYTQNPGYSAGDVNTRKHFIREIFGPVMSGNLGLQFYGTSGSVLKGGRVTDCIFLSRFLMAGGSYADDNEVVGNALGVGMQFSWSDIDNGSLLIEDNLIAGNVSLWTRRQSPLTVQNNRLFTNSGLEGIRHTPRLSGGVETWQNNSYKANSLRIKVNDLDVSIAEWQASGRDTVGSTFTAAQATPVVEVYACTEGVNKANIFVYNPASAASVAVDVSSLGLVNGATYRLRNAYNPLNAIPTASANVITFVYDGSGSINVSFTNRTRARPTSYPTDDWPIPTDIGAWRLEYVSGP